MGQTYPDTRGGATGPKHFTVTTRPITVKFCKWSNMARRWISQHDLNLAAEPWKHHLLQMQKNRVQCGEIWVIV